METQVLIADMTAYDDFALNGEMDGALYNMPAGYTEIVQA